MNTGDSLRIDTRWPEIDALLDLVLDQPEDRRLAWLQAHCDDAELRTLVQSLLDADSVRGAGIQARADAAHGWLDARAAELPQVPGYHVLRLIGEGGMASVFLAERMLGQTVQRVALKRLRLNVYDPGERRRFEHEHRLLARLEHPHIAHLLDAGIAPDGVPWFAMEYIEGEPLVAWCDARRLGTDTRLALFADICTAVQHAHQHLVVHRDLKPSNILVDDEGHVKLLDFGIGRLLEPDTDRPDGTRTELRRLTPGYAAPEQYVGHASTATDIYALGVILVELLSGRKPPAAHDPGSDPLRNATVTHEAAAARASRPRALERLLAGDLGAIARKATRSEPPLRYASAQALADDLAALRTGRPVAARRGDWRYRAACFIRRNKVAVAASLALVATLAVTTAISLYQAREARAQAARAQAVQGFVENMLAPLRIGVPATRMPKLDEVLAQGVHDLENHRQRDPQVYSELLTMFTRTYDRMGEVQTAHELANRAYTHAEQAFGREDPRAALALALRGRAHLAQENLAAARADLETARRLMRRHGIGGVALAGVLDDLGNLHIHAHRAAEAIPLFTEAQRERERELGPQHPDLSIGYANLALAEDERRDPEAALALYERAYRQRVQHEGTDTREAALLLGQIAGIKSYLGRPHDSMRDHMAVIAIFDKLEQQDPMARYNLALDACSGWWLLDELTQALAQCDAAVALAARHWHEDSRQHATARRFRMGVLIAQGRLREARAEAAQIRAVLQGLPGETADASLQLVAEFFSPAQQVEGDYAAMRDDLHEALRSGIFDHWLPLKPTVLARLALACAHAPAADCPPDLLARADHALNDPVLRRLPIRIETQLTLAQLMLAQDDASAAHTRLDAVESIAAQPQVRLKPGHRWLAEARMLRGDAFAAQGDRAAAQREWQAAEAVFASRYAADHPFRQQLARHMRQRVVTR